MSWSPDSKKIAYVDISQTLYWLDLQTGVAKKIVSDPIVGGEELLNAVWSPDSRWIAYALTSRASIHRVYAYSLEQSRSFAVTDGLSDVAIPAFDRTGKYLYLLASTNAGPARQWFMQEDVEARAQYSLYVAVLQRDAASPLAPQSDEEKGPARSAATDSAVRPEPPVRIDFDDLPQRILDLPVPAGSYRDLQSGAAGEVYYLRTLEGKTSLERFNLAQRKAETVVPEAEAYDVSPTERSCCTGPGTRGSSFPPRAKWKRAPGSSTRTRSRSTSIRAPNGGRCTRKHGGIVGNLFYDPGMHGADWKAIREKYRVFCPI